MGYQVCFIQRALVGLKVFFLYYEGSWDFEVKIDNESLLPNGWWRNGRNIHGATTTRILWSQKDKDEKIDSNVKQRSRQRNKKQQGPLVILGGANLQ
jgi:hypothetical protein